MRFEKWIEKRQLDEGATRYSVEINYRTKTQEVLEGFSKIALGYVSAGLKKHGYHVKQIFDEKPMRIIVSSRNWDDGEWVCMISYSSKQDSGCFIISNGFYNKDRKTISIQRSEKCKSDSPSEMVKDVINMMRGLKDKPDRHMEKLNPVRLKRGPKKR
jgi:hypothetical protein